MPDGVHARKLSMKVHDMPPQKVMPTESVVRTRACMTTVSERTVEGCPVRVVLTGVVAPKIFRELKAPPATSDRTSICMSICLYMPATSSQPSRAGLGNLEQTLLLLYH